MNRCSWCLGDPDYIRYHDEVWGVPEFDDRRLFAKLILDGAQAGLSWLTILRKEKNYYRAFDQFDPEKMARYNEAKIQQLLSDSGIVRNRLKVTSAVKNARAFLELQDSGNGFGDFLWQFVGGATRQNVWRDLTEIPPQTSESEAMSRALKKSGFTFVGPTICYAFMQAVGMVNDHLADCFRYSELGGGLKTSEE